MLTRDRGKRGEHNTLDRFGICMSHIEYTEVKYPTGQAEVGKDGRRGVL